MLKAQNTFPARNCIMKTRQTDGHRGNRDDQEWTSLQKVKDFHQGVQGFFIKEQGLTECFQYHLKKKKPRSTVLAYLGFF